MTASSESKKYTIAEVIEIYGLSYEEVAKMAGISVQSVTRNAEGSPHKTKDVIADLLATALGMNVDEITWINGVTCEGRFPGKWSDEAKQNARRYRVTHDITVTTRVDRLCATCNAVLPIASAECSVCGSPVE